MPFHLAREIAACGGWGVLVFSGLLLAGAIALAWTAFRPGRRTGIAPRFLAGVLLFVAATWAAGASYGALDPSGAVGCRTGGGAFEPLLLLLPLGLVGWVALCIYGVAVVGGWRRLAERYPSSRPIDGQRFDMESLHLGWFGRYSNCVEVTVGGKGISLQPMVPFRIGHPRLTIPWADVVGHQRRWGLPHRTVVWLASGRALTFYGAAGDAIAMRCDPLSRRYSPVKMRE